MGLLYGHGDPDRTITIATRCGQDSDCNPANAAGILFTTIGYSRLPERFTSGLDTTIKFNSTPYTFPQLIAVCEQLADQAVRRAGGRIDSSADGRRHIRDSRTGASTQRTGLVLEPRAAIGKSVQLGGDEEDSCGGEIDREFVLGPARCEAKVLPAGQRDYSSIRLSRHALERFAERFGIRARIGRGTVAQRSCRGPGGWAVTRRTAPSPCWQFTLSGPWWRSFRIRAA